MTDNLVTNEAGFQSVLPGVVTRNPSGGAYLGVGPEQNFTYIAAIQPEVSFVIDIRRENRDLHLMYKALFGLARDRVEFLSMLFSRALPDGLAPDASLQEIFRALSSATPNNELHDRNVARITTYLRETLALPLQDAEIANIKLIVQAVWASHLVRLNRLQHAGDGSVSASVWAI
jgi:hypothetical protein